MFKVKTATNNLEMLRCPCRTSSL